MVGGWSDRLRARLLANIPRFIHFSVSVGQAVTVKEPHYDSARAAHRKDPRRKALLIALTESYCCPAAALEFVQTRTSPEAETWRDELPGHVWIAGRIVESMSGKLLQTKLADAQTSFGCACEDASLAEALQLPARLWAATATATGDMR